MLTWTDLVAEMPEVWSIPIAEKSRRFQQLLPTDPLEAAKTILELDDLWRDLEQSDDLTPLLARSLNPCSPRGCHDHTSLSQHAWWLAHWGKRNSATVLLETFQPENRWADLARATLDGERLAPTSITSYRGKLRSLIEQVRQGKVEDIALICRANPRCYLADSRSEDVAFELAHAGYAELAEDIWQLDPDYWNEGIFAIVELYQALGNFREARRLGKLALGRSWKMDAPALPITSSWADLAASAAKQHRGFETLLKQLLEAFPPSKRLRDPMDREVWVEHDTNLLEPVCHAAWKALQGLDWAIVLDGADRPLTLANWAKLCECTGRLRDADDLRSRLPSCSELDYVENNGSSLGDIQFAEQQGAKLRIERERMKSLQLLLEQGRLTEAIDQSNTIELFKIAQILEPSDNWDEIEVRVGSMVPSSYKIRLLLLLGKARRRQGRIEAAQDIFAAVPQVHPQPIKAVGGDRIAPFHRPSDILEVAKTVADCLDPDQTEPRLISYLLELPTSGILVKSLIDLVNWPRALKNFQGPGRLIIENLVGRYADFPLSGRIAVGHLAWLHPQQVKEFERLLKAFP